MIAANNDPTLIFVLGSIGVLLFGAIGYGIYTTVGPKSGELRDTCLLYTSPSPRD